MLVERHDELSRQLTNAQGMERCMRYLSKFVVVVTMCNLLANCAKKESKDEEVSLPSELSPQSGGVASQTQQSQEQKTAEFVLATRSTLPDCAFTDRLYFLTDENVFVVCHEGVYATLDMQGATGPQGVAGQQGASGPSGASGTPGLPSTAVAVYDADSNQIGSLFTLILGGGGGMDMIMFKNGGFARFNLTTGNFHSGIGIDSNNSQLVGNGLCHFLSGDCTGECFWSESTHQGAPMRNTLVFNGTDLFQVTGDEVDAGVQIFNSIYGAAGCATVGGPYGRARSFLMETVFEIPDGLTMPLAAPLYFGTPASE